MGLGNPLNQSMKPQASQLIAHAALSELFGGLAQQGGEVVSRIAVREAGRQQVDQQQCVPDRLYHWIGEAESRNPLVVHDAGTIDGLDSREATVGRKADLQGVGKFCGFGEIRYSPHFAEAVGNGLMASESGVKRARGL